MKIHRFYTGGEIELKSDFWVHDEALLWQWNRVLRFKEGREVVLFDGRGEDRLYKIKSISNKEAHLNLITELEPKIPKTHVYLFWSLIKSDKNDLVIQKCTELGVTNFVPIISERSVKTGFNMARAEKIAVEASEQCGRSTIPHIREPIHINELLGEYSEEINLLVCHFGHSDLEEVKKDEKIGIVVGPEGGFTDDEVATLVSGGASILELGQMTLRAETASIVAVSKFL